MPARRQFALSAFGSILAVGFAHKTFWASGRSVELSVKVLADLPPDLKITFCALDMIENVVTHHDFRRRGHGQAVTSTLLQTSERATWRDREGRDRASSVN